MKNRLSRRIFGLIAKTAVVAIPLFGCMASQESGEELRQFAPRLAATPPCKRIRVEVAEWNMQENSNVQSNGNGYYQSKEADVSQNKLTMDGIPWGRTLYFRISGLDTTNSVVWSSLGTVPDVQQPNVTVGTGGYAPQTVAAPSIQTTSDPLAPRIQCGSNWPAWTTDGSTVSEKNPNNRIDWTMSQVVVTLASGQKMSARCTDGHNWSPPIAYQAPSGPTALPAQTGPGSDFTLSPTPFVPSGSAGTITFSANTSLFGGFSNWKLAYRLNNTGSWIVQDFTAANGVSFNGLGKIEAYLIAWNGTKWVSGSASSAIYPNGPTNPVATGPGNDISAPTVTVPNSLPGNIGVAKTAATSDLVDWKIAYRLGMVGTWEIVDYSANSLPVQTAGSMDIYLMAWSTTQNRWMSGVLASVSYPTGPTTLPAQNGPGTDFTMSPSINVPSATSGTITFTASTASFMDYRDWKIAYRMNNAGSWIVQDYTAATGVSYNGTGAIEAYLVAWSNTQGKWVSGPGASKNFGPSPNEVAIVTPGGPLPSVVIRGTSGLPGVCTFSFSAPAAMSTSYSHWKIVYQLPNSPNWIAIDTGNTVPFNISGNLSAYLEAWSVAGQQWVSGPMNNLYVPTMVVVDPPVFKDANGNVLDSSWEQDGATLSLQIAGSGTIYYTTNNNQPFPGMSGTSVWDPAQKLTFPLDLSTLTIQAVSQTAGATSSPRRLIVSRPLWTRLDNNDAGCVHSDGALILACGDPTGPWRWDTTTNKWKPFDAAWPVGQVQQLLITPKFVFATTRTGGIRRFDRTLATGRFVELNLRTRPANVGGLAVARDTLWVSSSTGPYFYDVVADTWAAPKLPASTIFNPNQGPAWSNGSVLWMAFGPELWRYGPLNGGASAWEHWNSTFPNISWLGSDPFSSTSAAMCHGTNFGQIGATRMVASTNYLNNNNGASIVQVVSHGTSAFAATDNGTGGGGVLRATGWSAQYWSSTERDWPSVSNRPVSSQGVAVFPAHGHTWLLATTPQGTYTVKLK